MKDLLMKLNIVELNAGATTGLEWIETKQKKLTSYSPINGEELASVAQASEEDYEAVMQKAITTFKKWRMKPAPERGLIVKEIGFALTKNKELLAELITLEVGKTISESLGEVQEMIDIADFALGLSRQLYGLTMHSERKFHRMYEQWHPLGAIGVVTSFNFPVAVWAWNALIAAVCGDVIVWKPSSKTPLTAIAVQKIIRPIIKKYDIDGVFNLLIGSGKTIGKKLINDRRMQLVSATGSCKMGRHIGKTVAARLGRSLLELGGNNAIIIAQDADLNMAVKAATFGSVGTAGQRCTSTRRLIIHNSIKQKVISQLTKAFTKINIGDPRLEETLMGPIIDQASFENMMITIKLAQEQGGKLIYGAKRITVENCEKGYYVDPTIIEAEKDLPIMQEETFAPLLYVISFETWEEAMEIHNGVDQGLSSALFTDSLRTSEKFLSHAGSDCGIANVNIATNGAEIGGAFGGEKDTGGGRESGSDAWKNYMRRQTNTINWGDDLPLAQGVTFEL